VRRFAISAYTAANTVIYSQVHHATVIRSLREKYGMLHLTERDRHAPDLSAAFNLEDPPDPGMMPSAFSASSAAGYAGFLSTFITRGMDYPMPRWPCGGSVWLLELEKHRNFRGKSN